MLIFRVWKPGISAESGSHKGSFVQAPTSVFGDRAVWARLAVCYFAIGDMPEPRVEGGEAVVGPVGVLFIP